MALSRKGKLNVTVYCGHFGMTFFLLFPTLYSKSQALPRGHWKANLLKRFFITRKDTPMNFSPLSKLEKEWGGRISLCSHFFDELLTPFPWLFLALNWLFASNLRECHCLHCIQSVCTHLLQEASKVLVWVRTYTFPAYYTSLIQCYRWSGVHVYKKVLICLMSGYKSFASRKSLSIKYTHYTFIKARLQSWALIHKKNRTWLPRPSFFFSSQSSLAPLFASISHSQSFP